MLRTDLGPAGGGAEVGLPTIGLLASGEASFVDETLAAEMFFGGFAVSAGDVGFAELSLVDEADCDDAAFGGEALAETVAL